MQLTDAEIREILARQKQRKKQKLRRKRRRTIFFILLILIIILIVILKPAVRISEMLDKQNKKAAREASYTGPPRGTIFLDPGHGGSDPGSDDGINRYEKDDTLRLALEIRNYLEALGFTVGMSRDTDEAVERSLRGKMANEASAQLFISIHRNKADGDGQGVEAFIPKHNEKTSRLLAKNIMDALVKQGFSRRSVRSGTLQSTKRDYDEMAAASMPAVLVEVGFISSDLDNALFDDNLSRNARAIANAIDTTFMELYEPEKAAQVAEQKAKIEKLTNDILYSTMEAISGIVPAHSKETEFPR